MKNRTQYFKTIIAENKYKKISLGSENRVKRIKTDVSEGEMISAINYCWRELFGTPPTKEQVSMIMAQNDLETDHRRAMWNYNVGNITTYAGLGYDYIDDLTTSEQVSPGKWEKRNLKYRAYNTLEDGVMDYLKFLSTNSRYSSAWEHIKNPDPEKYSKALKAAGYYTANEAPYTKAFISLFNDCRFIDG